MTIHGFGRTDKGLLKENNEDNIYIDGNFVPDVDIASAAFCIDKERFEHTVAVFDGIGGADCGEFASLAAAMLLKECDIKRITDINECIYELNNAVLVEVRKRKIRGMGSTAAVVHIEDNELHYANVGDSRIYLYDGGQLEQLSVDHTRNQMLKDLGINDEELLKRYDHQLSQNLGISEDDFIIEPATGCRKLKDGDIVILCSDGITDVVSDIEIEELLSNNTGADVQFITNNLFDLAIEKASRDNLSLIVLKSNYNEIEA